MFYGYSFSEEILELVHFKVVGSGPAPKIKLPEIAATENSYHSKHRLAYLMDHEIPIDCEVIERKHRNWLQAINFRNKLWRMKLAKGVDGETFGIYYTNPKSRDKVKLDLWVIETDQVSSFEVNFEPTQTNEIDGVRFDKYNNPESYHVLASHPGTNFVGLSSQTEGSWVRAKYVTHWFRQDRGWLRGIPEITPSLPLCALLRRYTLAVVQSAEIAASMSVLLESEGPPNTTPFGNMDSLSPAQIEDQFFDAFPIMRGMMMSLPWGMRAKQMSAEQPTAVYERFVDSLIREIMRPLNMPFNIASGFSGGYNFASGTLDKQIYWSSHKQDRLLCESAVLDPITQTWWEEAKRQVDYFEQDIIPSDQSINGQTELPEHEWGWDDDPDHPDPQKVANSLVTLRDANIISDKDIQRSRYNRDREEHYQNLIEEQQRKKELGLIPPVASPSTPSVNNDEEAEDRSEEENSPEDNSKETRND